MGSPYLNHPALTELEEADQSAAARLCQIIDVLLGLAPEQQVSNTFYTAAAAANQDAVEDVNVPCVLVGYDMVNVAAAARYVKFYNKAAPTSADIPVRIVAIGPGQSISRSALNILFSVALSTRITTGSANNDAGTATAGDVTFSLDYRLVQESKWQTHLQFQQ